MLCGAMGHDSENLAAPVQRLRPRPITRIAILSLFVCVLFAPPALAFHRQLSPEQVREAYVIGRDQGRRDAFFASYIHSPRIPDTGPDVRSIEFRTPYEQIAIRARDNQWSNYSPADAEQDYGKRPSEVIVRVLIYETPAFNFPASHGSPSQPDLAGFNFRVIQANRQLGYGKVTVEDAVPVGAGSGPGGDDGLDIQLHFTISQFTSGDPVTVEVLAPTGQTYSTTFGVASLK